ncbi:hypothetical protein EB05_01241 [Enterococcus faecium]|uniref:restriction endonuclease subunit S n=1 Tax=Enterococcus faecium TaxID=1352 RepID=UPI000DE83803|nr:restriction endonuclease subunit S [Enterococcus faecium]EGP4921850.1 restriction endonuclease subunit S [Enterococcus faecium]MBT0735846.1 restriction endonuclease subunit S [Enterococcus faecium]NRQ29598.1 restriction endonuclease subunit S [Enterococcus faecium]RBT41641.1 hypothetical protein EB05_01241 [Enterococcus faecium]
MSKDKQPEIRFPGFTEDWEQRKLGDVFSERSERSSEGELISVTINSGVIKASELDRKDNSSDNKSNYKKVEVGDIAYNSMRMWQGASGYSSYEGILSPAYTVIIPKEGTDSKFFAYDFKRYDMIQTFKRNSQGLTSDTWNLKFPTLKLVKIMVPSIEEQKQIAAFFERLDNTIALHERELDVLKETKKGFLQKMFPKNGAKVPEIRFPGFTEDWEQRKFKEFSKKTGKKNTKDLDFPAYSVSNKAGLISQTEQFDGSRLDDLEKTNYKFVEPNEFAYNPARVNVGSIAFNNLGMTVIVSSLYVVVKMSEDLDNEFILQFIKSPTFIKEVKRNTEGSVREYLFYENFANIKFPFTRNKEEQQKIGAFFKQLDDTIALHQRKLDLLKETKKGFLQKMFV